MKRLNYEHHQNGENLDQNGNVIGHFQPKNSLHKFSNTHPSNLVISKLTHFKQTFSLQNQKTRYSTTLKTFFTEFQISLNFEGTTLEQVDFRPRTPKF